MHLRYYEKVVSQTSKQLQRRGYKIEDISGWKHSSILSLDWFKGKYAGKAPYVIGKTMVSCRFSLEPIQWSCLCDGWCFRHKKPSTVSSERWPINCDTSPLSLRQEFAYSVRNEKQKALLVPWRNKVTIEIPFSSWNQQQFNPQLISMLSFSSSLVFQTRFLGLSIDVRWNPSRQRQHLFGSFLVAASVDLFEEILWYFGPFI